MSDRYAFATLVTSDSYLPGALAVAAALKEVHPSPPVNPEVPFQIVCIVSPETVDVKTIKFLRKAFDVVIGVEVIEEELSEELKLLGESQVHIFASRTRIHPSGKQLLLHWHSRGIHSSVLVVTLTGMTSVLRAISSIEDR